ncbi:MAG: hypothetical protein H8E40_12730, partial [Chloroflexi bacterium]|nr:hypothetical protein [Chloroflexota bacterium]
MTVGILGKITMSNVSTLIPKLWFDIHSQEGSASEGQCDCDCACPTSAILDEDGTLSKVFAHHLNTEGIRDIFFNQDTFLNRVGPHWTVLNAKGGWVVVLDDQARRLFSYLPSTQEELRTQLSEWPTEVFERIIALLFAVNVLSSPQIEYDDTVQSKSDTLVALLHL